MRLKTSGISFFSGLLFAIGLGVSGMTMPQKVIGFLDIFGEWDPSLAFVMIGALTVHGLASIAVRRKSSPIFTEQFHLPSSSKIDKKLIFGASLFGLGWGAGGFCPGPALTSLASADRRNFIFVGSMLAGMWIYKLMQKKLLKDSL